MVGTGKRSFTPDQTDAGRRPRRRGRASGLRALLLGLGVLSGANGLSADSHAQVPVAEGPAVRVTVLGGLRETTQYRRHEQAFWETELPARSGGRITATVTPFDQFGLTGRDVLRLVSLGSVQFGVVIPATIHTDMPVLAGQDMVGLFADITSLREGTAAWRQAVTEALATQARVEVVATWTYPAQLLFCRRPFQRLTDIAGLRVRTASGHQAALVTSLGAQAVGLPYAQITAAMSDGRVDCAITGGISANLIGLHRVATHVLTMPIVWGINHLVANQAFWRRLSPDLRQVFEQEFQRVTEAIWDAAEAETASADACNAGRGPCSMGTPGTLSLVVPTARDRQTLRDALTTAILPEWFAACGPACAAKWKAQVAPVIGLRLP
ncbi:MAG: TRAP transporter substrate-binding protein DctP [Alphaproteobacteria bacterium]|nr:TRAP transporter substrate-binding protein DctP [Alphaproteobacteria bacterium]